MMTAHHRKAFALLPLAMGGALAASSAVEAAQLSFGHFAPAAGTVRLEVDGRVAATASYRGFESKIALDAGRHVLRAVAADGRELAHGELQALGADASVVMLAGNGTAAAPYELRVSLDHNHPVRAASYSLQFASLAISATPVETRESCGNLPEHRDAFPYGTGSASLGGGQDGGANLKQGSIEAPCRFELVVDGESRSAQSASREPGARLRAFGIGDGVNEPFELLMVRQDAKPETDMQLGPGVAGLWYPAGDKPGISVVVAYDAERPERQRFSAIVSAFGQDGKPIWRLIDHELQIVDYRGGNPSGTHPALPQTLGHIEDVVWHSCNELTLVPGPDASGIFNSYPRNAMRLKRLLPARCEPTTQQAEVL